MLDPGPLRSAAFVRASFSARRGVRLGCRSCSVRPVRAGFSGTCGVRLGGGAGSFCSVRPSGRVARRARCSTRCRETSHFTRAPARRRSRERAARGARGVRLGAGKRGPFYSRSRISGSFGSVAVVRAELLGARWPVPGPVPSAGAVRFPGARRTRRRSGDECLGAYGRGRVLAYRLQIAGPLDVSGQTRTARCGTVFWFRRPARRRWPAGCVRSRSRWEVPGGWLCSARSRIQCLCMCRVRLKPCTRRDVPGLSGGHRRPVRGDLGSGARRSARRVRAGRSARREDRSGPAGGTSCSGSGRGGGVFCSARASSSSGVRRLSSRTTALYDR